MYYQQQGEPVNYQPQQPPPYAEPVYTQEHQHERSPLAHSRSPEEKFPDESPYRDVLFAVIFIFHLIGFLVLFVFGVVKYKGLPENPTNDDITPLNWREIRAFIGICVGCAGFSFVVSFLYIQLVRRFARQMIIGTLIATAVFCIVNAIMVFVSGYIWGGVILLIFALLQVFFYFIWRSRIPFASTVLKTVATVVQEYPATSYTAYASLVVHFIWIFLWACTVIFVQAFAPDVYYTLAAFLILSFYWTTQVIKNVVHVTVSGTVATWYFMKGTVGIPPNPTMKALRRACTYSFGSICLGSLLVAAIQTLRAIINGVRNRANNLVLAIIDCLLSCLEGIFLYFNKYAYTQVAIYGKTYCTAARDTWQLIKSHGVEAIINDDLISGVLTMGAILGGLTCGIFGGVLGWFVLPHYWISTAVAGGLIGFTFVLLTMEVIDSGVSTIFVSFAMDPEALRRNDPELYEKFRERYANYSSLWV